MKKLFASISFLFLTASFVAAQGNGGWNGNNWNNGNSSSIVTEWLTNGGQIPQSLAFYIIHEGKDAAMETFGLTQGQMMQRYFQGLLTIESVSTNPPSFTFRISFGGGTILVVIDAL